MCPSGILAYLEPVYIRQENATNKNIDTYVSERLVLRSVMSDLRCLYLSRLVAMCHHLYNR